MRYISIFTILLVTILSSCSSRSGAKATSSESETLVSSSEESDNNSDIAKGTSNELFSDTDSPDWDDLLDSYEQYVDKYIYFAKKATKGDMDALSEYPALMEKAQEFGDKMENAQSEMSASQWERYMKITTKMIQAVGEMQ